MLCSELQSRHLQWLCECHLSTESSGTSLCHLKAQTEGNGPSSKEEGMGIQGRLLGGGCLSTIHGRLGGEALPELVLLEDLSRAIKTLDSAELHHRAEGEVRWREGSGLGVGGLHLLLYEAQKHQA